MPLRAHPTLLLFILPVTAWQVSASLYASPVAVTQVTDGDTIKTDSQNIRLHGIDAPETHQPHGKDATAALKAFIQNRRVRLEVRREERYGESIAVVYRGERNVNRWVVRTGSTRQYEQNSHDPALGRLERAVKPVGPSLDSNRPGTSFDVAAPFAVSLRERREPGLLALSLHALTRNDPSKSISPATLMS